VDFLIVQLELKLSLFERRWRGCYCRRNDAFDHGRREPRRARGRHFVSKTFSTFHGKFSKIYPFPEKSFDFHPPKFL